MRIWPHSVLWGEKVCQRRRCAASIGAGFARLSVRV